MPRVVLDHYAIRIYFGEILHLHIDRSKLLGMQSWTDGNFDYSIEYVMRGGSVRTEYSDRGTWEAILKSLDGIL